MNLARDILAIIGAYFIVCAIFLAAWIIAHHHVRRRGGLLDLTARPDSRKNARGAA